MTNTDIAEQRALAGAHAVTSGNLNRVTDQLAPMGAQLQGAVWGDHSPAVTSAVKTLVDHFHAAVKAFDDLGVRLDEKATANQRTNNNNAGQAAELASFLNAR